METDWRISLTLGLWIDDVIVADEVVLARRSGIGYLSSSELFIIRVEV